MVMDLERADCNNKSCWSLREPGFVVMPELGNGPARSHYHILYPPCRLSLNTPPFTPFSASPELSSELAPEAFGTLYLDSSGRRPSESFWSEFRDNLGCPRRGRREGGRGRLNDNREGALSG